jgi:hypothetical protein
MKGAKSILTALLAVIITVGVLWFAHRESTPTIASWKDVLNEAKRGGYRLIGTNELWQHYQTKPESVLLVDTRQEWEFRTGHMKGALNFPIEPTWLSRWQKKRALETFLGPDKNRFIVFY